VRRTEKCNCGASKTFTGQDRASIDRQVERWQMFHTAPDLRPPDPDPARDVWTTERAAEVIEQALYGLADTDDGAPFGVVRTGATLVVDTDGGHVYRFTVEEKP
jgi:hypothetical protein